MKRNWIIPAVLVAGLSGVAVTHAVAASESGSREGSRSERSDRGYDKERCGERGWRHHGRGHGRHGEHRARHHGHGPRHSGGAFNPARLDSVKKELGVTPAQEQAWTKYTSTLKEVADARRARRDSFDRGAISRMSAEEHRKFRDSMIEQRRKEQDSVNAAVDGLVNTLDGKQVAVAKEVLPGYAFGGGMRGGPRGGR